MVGKGKKIDKAGWHEGEGLGMKDLGYSERVADGGEGGWRMRWRWRPDGFLLDF